MHHLATTCGVLEAQFSLQLALPMVEATLMWCVASVSWVMTTEGCLPCLWMSAIPAASSSRSHQLVELQVLHPDHQTDLALLNGGFVQGYNLCVV